MPAPTTARPLRVLFLDPFHGGSHRAFAKGWAERSAHRVTLLVLPPRFWKWRLRGAAFTFAERLGGRADAYDIVVATSLMNAADFRAAARLTRPLVIYFHENQLTYPRPPDEPLDHGLALASLSSAAAADAVVFNSRTHRDTFVRGLEEWLRRFPEHAPARTARAVRRKVRVLHPAIDWAALAPLALRRRSGDPVILWNHRWEFDKNPGAFFAAMSRLAERGWPFRLAILGESTQAVPRPFLEGRAALASRIARFGYAPSTAAYRAWLGRSDIVVSTASQENFGIAVAEAIAAGAFPVLPARLSYPELLPAGLHADCLYRSQSDLIRRLEALLRRPESFREGRRERSRAMRRFDWSRLVPRLDGLLAEVAARPVR